MRGKHPIDHSEGGSYNILRSNATTKITSRHLAVLDDLHKQNKKPK